MSTKVLSWLLAYILLCASCLARDGAACRPTFVQELRSSPCNAFPSTFVAQSSGLQTIYTSDGVATASDKSASANLRNHPSATRTPTPSIIVGSSPTASLTPIGSNLAFPGRDTKKGLVLGDTQHAAAYNGKNLSWCYNWDSSWPTGTNGREFIPMLWSDGPRHTATWLRDVETALAGGSSAILGFNEPDHSQQANMPVTAAAQAYRELITAPFRGRVRLGSVAVTNGAGTMGLGYLDQFMQACTDCDIDFVAVHWYDQASNVGYFKSHITEAHTRTQKPVWITEFGCVRSTDAQVQEFLRHVIPWLEAQPFVERYSYFFDGDGVTGRSSLSAVAETYVETWIDSTVPL